MPTTTQPLSIAIIGAGRIGSSFAYLLAKAGHDVTLIARPGSNRLAQISRDGGIVLTTGERATATIDDQLDEGRPYDAVFVTVLAHQVGPLLPALKRSKAGTVVFTFATPEADRLATAIGPDRAQFGFAGVLATLDADGRLDLTIQRVKAVMEDQRWVDLFTEAGAPAKRDPQLRTKLRGRATLTLAMESVTAMGMAHGRGANLAEARLGVRAIKGAAKILRASGDKSVGPGQAPGLVLAGLLLWASRAPFRTAVGNSDSEVKGLIDLYVAEARSLGGLEQSIDALEALRPGVAPGHAGGAVLA